MNQLPPWAFPIRSFSSVPFQTFCLQPPPIVAYFQDRQKLRACSGGSVRALQTIFTFSLLLILSLSTRGFAQSSTGMPPIGHRVDSAPSPEDETQERIAHDLAKKANQDRQAVIKNDTEKLVKLTAELKEYVDKSNENMLSLDVIKKAEEIEKLAKSVKEKMRGQN
jgi:hypothetical protein